MPLAPEKALVSIMFVLVTLLVAALPRQCCLLNIHSIQHCAIHSPPIPRTVKSIQ
ncbi:MAG: hypothetical protein IPG31_00305 [Nitrosomonas sp.]|nr:hypothetical protein [Nitrosomonas sp.]